MRESRTRPSRVANAPGWCKLQDDYAGTREGRRGEDDNVQAHCRQTGSENRQKKENEQKKARTNRVHDVVLEEQPGFGDLFDAAADLSLDGCGVTRRVGGIRISERAMYGCMHTRRTRLLEVFPQGSIAAAVMEPSGGRDLSRVLGRVVPGRRRCTKPHESYEDAAEEVRDSAVNNNTTIQRSIDSMPMFIVAVRG
jgi:hypothetical protein